MNFSEIEQVIQKCFGKPALISRKLGVTLEQFEKIALKNPKIRQTMLQAQKDKESLVQEIADIQVKFAAINGEPWALKEVLSLRTQMRIMETSREQLVRGFKIDGNEYQERYDTYARDYLALTPFATDVSLSSLFSVSDSTIVEWATLYPSFYENMKIGISQSEKLSRDLLLSASLGKNGTDPQLLRLLSKNAFGISLDENRVNIVVEPGKASLTIEEQMKEHGIPIPEVIPATYDEELYSDAGTSDLVDGDQVDYQAIIKELRLESIVKQSKIQELSTKISEIEEKTKPVYSEGVASPFGDV